MGLTSWRGLRPFTFQEKEERDLCQKYEATLKRKIARKQMIYIIQRKTAFSLFLLQCKMRNDNLHKYKTNKRKALKRRHTQACSFSSFWLHRCLGCQRLKKRVRTGEMVQALRPLLWKPDPNSVTRGYVKMAGEDHFESCPLPFPCVVHTATHTIVKSQSIIWSRGGGSFCSSTRELNQDPPQHI